MSFQIIHSDCVEAMKKMENSSIDFCITDPPYGINFMGKEWDYKIPSVNTWKELKRILKPGAMIAVFGGSRTHHRMVCNIEDAGFEIRDCIMWVYGSGFPKSHNHFGFQGYGTALKPAHEPICLAMKPLDGTFAQNADKWGVAGINIDDSRIGTNKPSCVNTTFESCRKLEGREDRQCPKQTYNSNQGRWPANIIFDEEAAQELDQQTGILKSGKPGIRRKHHFTNSMAGTLNLTNKAETGFGDCGGASRFFYCAKASLSERTGSTHPTVKPLALMRYIIKLLAPPGNPILIDPFTGSGSTIVAAKELGISSIGIEKEKEYCEIAEKRLHNPQSNNEQYEMNLQVI